MRLTLIVTFLEMMLPSACLHQSHRRLASWANWSTLAHVTQRQNQHLADQRTVYTQRALDFLSLCWHWLTHSYIQIRFHWWSQDCILLGIYDTLEMQCLSKWLTKSVLVQTRIPRSRYPREDLLDLAWDGGWRHGFCLQHGWGWVNITSNLCH